MMASVLLVSNDLAWALRLAQSAAGAHLVLLDDAAAAARATHPLVPALRAASDSETLVWVHDEALARRGMTTADVTDGVKTVTMDEIADLVGSSPGAVAWL